MLTEVSFNWMVRSFKDNVHKIREIILNSEEYESIGSIHLRVLNKERSTILIPRTGEYTYDGIIDILENYDREVAKGVLNLWDIFMTAYANIEPIELRDITINLDILFDRNKITFTIDHILQFEKELKR
nr:MAG TPA: hypothetical protein [Caudoviricetes sp.]